MEQILDFLVGLTLGEQECVDVPVPIFGFLGTHSFEHCLEGATETFN